MICFHFTIFVVLETTFICRCSTIIRLWFAFILLSLSYWKQQLQDLHFVRTGCDLLSFYYLCRTGNNRIAPGANRNGVVICFHFTIFVVLETTTFRPWLPSVLLWFAFILLSLSYWKQPTACLKVLNNCCDLLSFYYLCRTGNNQQSYHHTEPAVVICFHFTIFVVLETTFSLMEVARSSCDLLSFYYLCRTGNNR